MSYINRELDDSTAAAIVRSMQKDEYYLGVFSRQISDALRAFSSSRNPHRDPVSIKMWTRLLYFGITTGIGAKTLGEQYVDLHYVNSGKRVRLWRRLLFALMYSTSPFVGSKLVKWLAKKTPEESRCRRALDFVASELLQDLQNLHLAIFYLKGRYYSFTKRILGLHYGMGYKKQEGESSGASEYEMLGVLVILQLIVKYTGYIRTMIDSRRSKDSEESLRKFKEEIKTGNVTKFPKNLTSVMLADTDVVIDLADANQLKYIPPANRSCMLCLDLMKDPSCGPCGHLYCWSCILEWCNERSECPLCRSPLQDNQLIPLR